MRQKVIGTRAPLADINERYILTEGFYTPHEHTGVLVGSFDRFRTSFVVGRHKSFIVPANAHTFSLAVNARIYNFTNMTGYFNIGVIVTPAPKVPTRTISRGNTTYSVPSMLPAWNVLTTHNVDTYFDEPLIRDGKVVANAMQP